MILAVPVCNSQANKIIHYIPSPLTPIPAGRRFARRFEDFLPSGFLSDSLFFRPNFVTMVLTGGATEGLNIQSAAAKHLLDRPLDNGAFILCPLPSILLVTAKICSGDLLAVTATTRRHTHRYAGVRHRHNVIIDLRRQYSHSFSACAPQLLISSQLSGQGSRALPTTHLGSKCGGICEWKVEDRKNPSVIFCHASSPQLEHPPCRISELGIAGSDSPGPIVAPLGREAGHAFEDTC